MQVTIDTSEQGTEEWHKARLGKFTASRAGDLMKTQKNGKPYATRKNYITEVALERITNQVPEFTESEAMREGKERERTAALAYSFATGNETEQTGFWHTDTFGASPDDLIVNQNGGVEYKNPLASTHYQTLMDKTIPEHYYWQIIQCLLVTGRDFWDYVSFHPDFPENAQLYIERVERTKVEKDIKRLHEELVKADQEVNELIKQVKEYK
jgi:predicted phage-related endonuclease